MDVQTMMPAMHLISKIQKKDRMLQPRYASPIIHL